MLRWFLRRRIAAFEREFDYDTSYARELLEVSPRALIALGRVEGSPATAAPRRARLTTRRS
jgi:hypothetical protein